MSKTCIKCGKYLPDEAFYEGKNRCKKCISAYNREHHKKTYDPAKRKEEYENNKEKYFKYYREHRDERIAYNSMYMRNKRANGNGATGKISQEEWNSILAKFGNRCAYCGSDGKPLGLGMDHIIPLANGGTHTPDNVVPACRSCNSQKHSTPCLEWYPKQPFYNPEKELKIVMHRMEGL